MDGAVFLFVAIARVEGFDRSTFVEELLQARLALVLGVLIGLIKPQGWPRKIGDDVAKPEFTDAGLAALDRGDDGNQTDGRIGQSLQRFTKPRGIVRAEFAGKWRVGDRGDVLFGPSPRRAAVGRLPDFAPNPVELLGVRHWPSWSRAANSSMATDISLRMPMASKPERIGGNSFSSLLRSSETAWPTW